MKMNKGAIVCEKYSQYRYLTKDLYLEFTKDFYVSIIKGVINLKIDIRLK